MDHAEEILLIEREIENKENGYFRICSEGYIFPHTYAGENKRLMLPFGIETARLLYKFKKIRMPEIVGKEVRMYNTTVLAGTANNGAFAEIEMRVPFNWEDAHFTQREAIEIIALDYFREWHQPTIVEKALAKLIPFPYHLNVAA